MIQKLIGLIRWSAIRAIMLVAVVCTTACSSVFDDEEDCTPYYYIKFVYNRNMLYADAFATQVSSVDLYVFDAETGEYITHFTDAGDALASGNYRMPLNLAPGKYKFIAWCGLGSQGYDYFSLPSQEEIRTEEDLKCTMARTRGINGAYSDNNLQSLFHGSTVEVLPDEEGEHIYTVYLTRDTNNIILTLEHAAGAFDKDRYDITMTDENGLLAFDNSLLKDEPIEYRPWDISIGSIDYDEKTDGNESESESSDAKTRADNKEIGWIKMEFSTSRLMADHEMRINIVDKQEDNKVIFSIPMIKYAQMFRSAHYAKMDAQEYLDREYEYDLMVFLDERSEGWMALSIVINGWHLIINDDVEL